MFLSGPAMVAWANSLKDTFYRNLQDPAIMANGDPHEVLFYHARIITHIPCVFTI
jgi:hypothetical protein